MKDQSVCRKKVKMIIKEIVREELGNFKQELGKLKKIMQGATYGPSGETQRSYNEPVKEKKKENIIIIESKKQQESETTKKFIKKGKHQEYGYGNNKIKKRKQKHLILGCETGEDMEKLKATVQAKLGEDFTITESPRIKPKLKVVNIGKEEMKLIDNNLLLTIKKQNKIDAKMKESMRIVKKQLKKARVNRDEEATKVLP